MAGREQAIEHTEYPFGKTALRSGGTQWGTTADDATGSTAAWVTVKSVTIEPPSRGKITELEIGVTWQQKNSSTGSFVNGRIVGRNKDGTWISLVDTGTSPATGNAYVQSTADATTYQEYTYSGRFLTTTDLDSVPFDLAVQIQREGTTGTASARVKSTSYVRVVYR